MLAAHHEIPAELVRIIAHYLVCAGLTDAWRLRGICRTFRDAIRDDIILHQPREHLRSRSSIMENLMPHYLFHQVQKRVYGSDELLDRITKMNAYMCQELQTINVAHQVESLRALCSGLALASDRHFVSYFFHNTSSVYAMESNSEDLALNEKVLAAMCMRSHKLVRALLSQLTTYRCRNDYLSPLCVAINLGDDEILRLALDHIAVMKAHTKKLTVQDIFGDCAIHCAFVQKFVAKLNLLFEAYRVSNLGGFKVLYHGSLETAIKWKKYLNYEVIRCILGYCPSEPKVHPNVSWNACQGKHAQLVRLLLGYIPNLDTGTVHMLPLIQAVKFGDQAVIKAVLDAGADINNTHYNRSDKAKPKRLTKSPLEVAATQKYEAVQVLLERGVVVPPVKSWQNSRKKIYDALREARMVQTGEDVPTFEDMQTRNHAVLMARTA
ncbi:hypothetical protein CC86DRAFT_277816 [Ophiobolus disseminans]|uniref:Uncharacterized protein n=1 Tax=Ophiobolus disseminans TaxID=1469910 RepID=A0A6A7ALI8_9PLEO|nr:hypothetical protein CC86DRAFT_277816 [Ophiobolus disseminans]